MRHEMEPTVLAGRRNPPQREGSGSQQEEPQTLRLSGLSLVEGQRVYVSAKRSPRTVKGMKGNRVQMVEDYKTTDYNPKDIYKTPHRDREK